MNQRKVILNLFVANNLIQKGFNVIELKPSRKERGKAVFIFEHTKEFDQALTDITKEIKEFRNNKIN